MIWLIYAVALLLFVEVIQWCFHAGWQAYVKHKNRLSLSCRTINYRMACIACVMTGLLGTFIFIWMTWKICFHQIIAYHCPLLCIGIYLSHIHFLAMLGRCTELDIYSYPPTSKFVATYIVPKFTRFD